MAAASHSMAAPVPDQIVNFAPEDTDAERAAKSARAKEAPKTLLIVAETLVGMMVDIELRNDTEIHGRLESVDREMNMELSAVRCRRAHERRPVQLEHMFVNGRYLRYIHIPDGVDIVSVVHSRMKAQGKAATTHRRTSEVIRESVARRERMKLAQENAVRSVIGEELVPTVGRRLGEAVDERLEKSNALSYMNTMRPEYAAARLKQDQAQRDRQAGGGGAPVSSGQKLRQQQQDAMAAGFVDKFMPACRDCKLTFVWTAGEQAFYNEKGIEHEPQRCKPCLKEKKEARETGGGGGGGRGRGRGRGAS